MFKHILVPTDLTEKSEKALEVAHKISIQHLCRVTLLHVIETIEDADYEEFEEFYERLKRRAQKKMDEMADRYRAQDLDLLLEIAYGKRVKEIVRFAHENAIDLIVLSSHRIDVASASQGWGTISYKVSILSHCPVMLIK